MRYTPYKALQEILLNNAADIKFVYLKNEFTMLLGAILAVEEVVGYGEIKIHSTECHVKDVDLNVSPFVCTAGITYNDGKAAIGYRFETSQDKIEAKNITVTYFTKK